MENLNLIKPEKVQNIINKFCYTIGMIPTSYKVSLTYEEQIIVIGHYLEETVIPALNNNAEAVAELQSLFVQLKDYVENYFTNLDVQEEINNKLDEMAKSGELQTLLMNFLNNSIFIFDNINDLKNSTYLVNNSYAKTLGYFSKNDNGNSLYFISNSNIEDETKIELQNNLFAYLIPINNTINIRQFGINYNEEDVTTKIQNLANYISSHNIEKLIFNSNDIINISNFIIFNLLNNKIFKIEFNNAQINLISSFRYFDNGIFNLNFNIDNNAICIIKNGNFDGSGNPPDFSSGNINPKGGRGMFFINGARHLKAYNCNFSNWFYSACFWTHFLDDAIIENCNGYNVGGRSADNTEDARGDALYFGYCGVRYIAGTETVDTNNSKEVNIKILNCNFKSYEAVDNPYSSLPSIRNGNHSGRCGIVFGEFSLTTKNKYLSIENSYFYNYQRVIHLENVDNSNIIINNSSFNEFGTFIIISDSNNLNKLDINNCNFNKNMDILAMYPDYEFIIAGANNINNNILFNFNNCLFNMKKMYIATYGMGSIINISNSNLIGEIFKSSSNSNLNFDNCIIKFNTSVFYKTLLKFKNCNIEGGYLHNEKSSFYIYSHEKPDFEETLNIIENCKLLNCGINIRHNELEIVNNNLTYDSNFSSKDVNNTTWYSMLILTLTKMTKFINNTINNETTTKYLNYSDLGTTNDYIIDNNNFNNIGLALFNQNNLSRISNNKFNTNTSNRYAIDFKGSTKCCLFNNIFDNFENPLNLQGNIIRFNNYYIYNDVVTKIVENPE